MTGQKKTLVACYVEKKYNQGIRTDTDEKQSNIKEQTIKTVKTINERKKL